MNSLMKVKMLRYLVLGQFKEISFIQLRPQQNIGFNEIYWFVEMFEQFNFYSDLYLHIMEEGMTILVGMVTTIDVIPKDILYMFKMT